MTTPPEACVPLCPRRPPAVSCQSRDVAWRLSAQRLAATCATCVQDLAPGLGGHARTEPMTTLAYEVRRLKGAFHRVLLRLVGPGARIRPPGLFEARAIGTWVWLVKRCGRGFFRFCVSRVCSLASRALSALLGGVLQPAKAT